MYIKSDTIELNKRINDKLIKEIVTFLNADGRKSLILAYRQLINRKEVENI